MKNKEAIIQFAKFGIVGISNTLLTAITIWILLKQLHFSDYLSNMIGYAIGVINSFVWNRKWTFESKTKVSDTIYKFIGIFGVCYLIQLGNLYLLLHFTNIDAYLSQLLSIVVYTILNFGLNKSYTFKR
ncbi:MAG: GtrA family protein [Paludibacter sp.]